MKNIGNIKCLFSYIDNNITFKFYNCCVALAWAEILFAGLAINGTFITSF